jgi:tyrosine-protein kinase Fer
VAISLVRRSSLEVLARARDKRGAMGFSTELQGQGAHEVLLQRQDAELRLLDNMRRCLVNKLKCDREFASGVAGVVVQANKRDWNDELQDSTLSKVNI